MQLNELDIERVNFGKLDGLVPAITRDAVSGELLMLGFMNREALEATIELGQAVFYSRTRGKLWKKGETSGHVMDVVEVRLDCDDDTLLFDVVPSGPVCHRGAATCFDDGRPGARSAMFLNVLENIIARRIAAPDENSYTQRLYCEGVKRIAQKVGEEAVELAIAASSGDDSAVVAESADLLYHLLVLIKARNLTLENIIEELEARHQNRLSETTR
ncbi:MAG: bifunctional phosphoribosyl-AMP cyclohydrolase/phosphoribosyl-ATP diphosphatase HisIE [Steroidobacteraceae bacterium]